MIESLTIGWTLACLALPPKSMPEPLPGYDWMAPPKRAPGEPAPPPRPAGQVVDDFVRYVESSPLYDAPARDFIRNQREKTADEDLPDFIHLAYAVLSPDFKRGLDLLDDENPLEAANTFERLAKSDDPFLAVAAANLAAGPLIEIEDVESCHALLAAVLDRHKPIENFTTASDQFRFMLGYCQVHRLLYDEAYATFEDFLRNHPNAPERFRTTAGQILTELSRRAPGRIGDVRDLLAYARRRIGLRATGDDVQEKQEEAVALLDALIEEAEQQENQGGGGDGEGGGQGGGGAGGQNPGGGANRSTLPGGEQRIGELRKTRAAPGEAWGKMPPRERDQILQTLQKQFPSQYRELLEQYYKQLAKDAPSP